MKTLSHDTYMKVVETYGESMDSMGCVPRLPGRGLGTGVGPGHVGAGGGSERSGTWSLGGP